MRLRQLAGLLVPGVDDHEERTLSWYRVYGDLFALLCDDSAILNFGWGDPDGPVDLLEAQKEMVRQVTALLEGETWLDVGCGLGGPAMLLAREQGRRLTGININPEQVEACRQRAREDGVEVDFVLGDAQRLPFSEEAFDGVYTIESPLHYPDKQAFLDSAFRVLRPGGGFALCDIVRAPKGTGLADSVGMEVWRWLYACPPLWSASDWAQGLRRAGFMDVDVRDVTRETLGLIPHWLERMDRIGPEVRRRYPPGVFRGARRLLAELGERLERVPIGYALLTARKPGAIELRGEPFQVHVGDLRDALELLSERPGLAELEDLETEVRGMLGLGYRRRVLEAGEVLFERRAPTDAVYLVMEGSLDEWGPWQRLAVRRPGQLVGELAVLAEDSRHTTQGLARERSEVLELPAGAFRQLACGPSGLGRALLQELAIHGNRYADTTIDQDRLSESQWFPGHRAFVVPGPYSGKAELLQVFCHLPADGFERLLPPGVRLNPAAPWCLLTMSRYPWFHATHAAEDVRMRYSETAVQVPVLVGLKPCLMQAYLYTDQAMALFAGREIYGFPKMEATTTIDHDIGRGLLRAAGQDLMTLRFEARRWDELEPDVRGELLDLFLPEELLGSLVGELLQLADEAELARWLKKLPEPMRTVPATAWKRVFSPATRLEGPGPFPWTRDTFQVDGMAGFDFVIEDVEDLELVELLEGAEGFRLSEHFIQHELKPLTRLALRSTLRLRLEPGEVLSDYVAKPPRKKADLAKLAWGPRAWSAS